jgi:hypothetical protein
MTKEQNYLIHLLKFELNGLPTESPDTMINWSRLFKLAARNGVNGILYQRVKTDLKDIIPEDVMSNWENHVLVQASRQISRTADLLKTLQLLQQKNIRFMLFKGLVMKQLYPQPEFRYMSDADLFVHSSSMAIAIQYLRQIGYSIPNSSMDHAAHIEMNRSFSCPLELHHSLWSVDFHNSLDLNAWYNHIWENARTILYEGISIPAFSIEDELIHCISHLSTHFIRREYNLLKVYDIALFIRKYGKEADWNYVDTVINHLGLQGFFNALLDLFKNYFGLANVYPMHPNPIKGTLSGKIFLKDIFLLTENQYSFELNGAFSSYIKGKGVKFIRYSLLLVLRPDLFLKKCISKLLVSRRNMMLKKVNLYRAQ